MSYNIGDVVDVVVWWLQQNVSLLYCDGYVKAVWNRMRVRPTGPDSVVRVYDVSGGYLKSGIGPFEDVVWEVCVDIRARTLVRMWETIGGVLVVLDGIKNDPNPAGEGRYDMLEVVGVDDESRYDGNEWIGVITVKVYELNRAMVINGY